MPRRLTFNYEVSDECLPNKNSPCSLNFNVKTPGFYVDESVFTPAAYIGSTRYIVSRSVPTHNDRIYVVVKQVNTPNKKRNGIIGVRTDLKEALKILYDAPRDDCRIIIAHELKMCDGFLRHTETYYRHIETVDFSNLRYTFLWARQRINPQTYQLWPHQTEQTLRNKLKFRHMLSRLTELDPDDGDDCDGIIDITREVEQQQKAKIVDLIYEVFTDDKYAELRDTIKAKLK